MLAVASVAVARVRLEGLPFVLVRRIRLVVRPVLPVGTGSRLVARLQYLDVADAIPVPVDAPRQRQQVEEDGDAETQLLPPRIPASSRSLRAIFGP